MSSDLPLLTFKKKKTASSRRVKTRLAWGQGPSSYWTKTWFACSKRTCPKAAVKNNQSTRSTQLNLSALNSDDLKIWEKKCLIQKADHILAISSPEHLETSKWHTSKTPSKWNTRVFPKNMEYPPNHPFLIGVSIIIHHSSWGFYPNIHHDTALASSKWPFPKCSMASSWNLSG